MKRILCFLSLLLALLSCSDNDSFTTSTSARLTFSIDTVKMDTVFSGIGSSTYSFWVFNNSGDGIRIASVRLAKGNQTGFRANVDGSYLDNALGSIVNNLEVRKGDSIRVFVELTAAYNHQEAAQALEDALVFKLESGVEQSVSLRGVAWDALLLKDLTINSDTLIESTKPLVVYGGIKVQPNATLTLRKTKLYFHDQAGIDVYGKLLTDSVLMRGDRLDHMFDYLPYDRVSGQWKGIRFYASSFGNELLNTEVRNATNAVVCDSSAYGNTPDKLRLYMEKCVVHNSKGNGVETNNAFVGLVDCQLTNALGDCVAIYGGAAVINGCTLGQFYPFSASRGVALRFSNQKGNYHYPLEILQMSGSIVTGYADDEVMGDASDEDVLFDYDFENCLLRTPEVNDTTRFSSIIWEKPTDEIQGKKHFVLIDEDNFIYDFHLDSLSTAKGLGCFRTQ